VCVYRKIAEVDQCIVLFIALKYSFLCSLHRLVCWRLARRRTKLLQGTENLFTYY